MYLIIVVHGSIVTLGFCHLWVSVYHKSVFRNILRPAAGVVLLLLVHAANRPCYSAG